jgi:hypothetical protein
VNASAPAAPLHPLGWRTRARPLPIAGAFAQGAAATALADRLLSLETLHLFQGLTADDVLVCLGEDPPWVDGAVFFGVEPEAPQLHLPTWIEPDVPAAILAAALAASQPGPVLLIPETRQRIALGAARPIDGARLLAWRQARQP